MLHLCLMGIKMKKFIFLAIYSLSFVSSICLADANYISGTETEITNISSYATGGVTGDVRILVKNTVAGCEAGYYVNSDNSGKESILSIALSAFHTNAKVLINAYDSPRWSGSSNNYCLIEGIDIRK